MESLLDAPLPDRTPEDVSRFFRADLDAVVPWFEYGLHVPQRAVAAHER